MAETTAGYEGLKRENEGLRQQNAHLLLVLEEVRARLAEPEDVIRAIRHGEIDALVVQEQGREEVYALQRFDSAYRVVVEECFPYGVWLAEPDGSLLYVSPSFLELLQTDLEQLRAKGQLHFVRPDARAAVERQWAECRRTGRPFNVHYTVPLQDGSERIIWTHGILTHTQDGQPRWVGVNIDVTEREKTREELRRQAEALQEADRRKDEFLALLGHELRNPLAPIRTAIDRLRLKIAPTSELHPVIDVVARQMDQMTRLVDELLDVSRITRGKVDLHKERADLGAVIAQAVETARPLIDSRRHDLSYTPPLEPLPLEADPTRLAQALSNILSNAAKYTDEGGRICLSAVREQGEAVVRVRDTGIGIAADLLPHVFDLFTQASHAMDRAQGGLGIGLTVARRLVEMHGGSLTAHSAGEGQGSEFVLRLPLVAGPCDSHRATQAGLEVPRRPAARRRILFVDDLAEVAEDMAALVREAFGHDVRTAHDGLMAVQVAADFRPEVVLLDLGLPGMSGYEVARRLRGLSGLDGVVLVALTGWGQDSDRRRTREAGFDHHLVKPVGLKEMQTLLAGLEPADAGPAPGGG